MAKEKAQEVLTSEPTPSEEITESEACNCEAIERAAEVKYNKLLTRYNNLKEENEKVEEARFELTQEIETLNGTISTLNSEIHGLKLIVQGANETELVLGNAINSKNATMQHVFNNIWNLLAGVTAQVELAKTNFENAEAQYQHQDKMAREQIRKA